MPDLRINRFLEYIDQEATVMGALSAFSMASIALLWNALAGAPASTLANTITSRWPSFIILIAASLCLLTAALLFYKQRSKLLLMYGEICLDSDESPSRKQIDTWRDGIRYGWTWYNAAFGTMSFGYVLILTAVVVARALTR